MYVYIVESDELITDSAIALCRPEDPVPDELVELKPSIMLGGIFGFFFGGFIGARWSADKFIAMNHNTKFPSVMQAQVGIYMYL